MGSPTFNSVGWACASMAKWPTFPEKFAGFPTEGTSRTSKRGALDWTATR